jgi:hypothetical protein
MLTRVQPSSPKRSLVGSLRSPRSIVGLGQSRDPCCLRSANRASVWPNMSPRGYCVSTGPQGLRDAPKWSYVRDDVLRRPSVTGADNLRVTSLGGRGALGVLSPGRRASCAPSKMALRMRMTVSLATVWFIALGMWTCGNPTAPSPVFNGTWTGTTSQTCSLERPCTVVFTVASNEITGVYPEVENTSLSPNQCLPEGESCGEGGRCGTLNPPTAIAGKSFSIAGAAFIVQRPIVEAMTGTFESADLAHGSLTFTITPLPGFEPACQPSVLTGTITWTAAKQ